MQVGDVEQAHFSPTSVSASPSVFSTTFSMYPPSSDLKLFDSPHSFSFVLVVPSFHAASFPSLMRAASEERPRRNTVDDFASDIIIYIAAGAFVPRILRGSVLILLLY
ncbi:hypothetical protein DL95DRAFT_389136, partial [Leptodontidium sp. 2 PMI_412]